MARYRFFFIDAKEHTVDIAKMADCANDADASLVATWLLGEQQKYPCVEIWESARKVAQHCR
jgi:hypothetical protein